MKRRDIGINYTDGTPIREFDILQRSMVTYKVKSMNPISFDYFEDKTSSKKPKYACLYVESKAAFCAVKIYGTVWHGEDIKVPMHEFVKSYYASDSMSGFNYTITKLGTCRDEEYKYVLEHNK